MKTHIKLILILLTSLPVLSFGQNIDANLKYINEQFGLYNDYGTVFSVDTRTKEIICEDEFGILKANFSDVEIREKSGNVGIFCLNENSKCIRYYGKDGARLYDQDYSDYTMGLKENDKMISHVNTVLSKFSEIKKMVLNGNSSLGTMVTNNTDVNVQVEAELRIINQIFQRSSEYKNVYAVDYATKTIIAKTESCEAIVPVKPGLTLNYYKRDGTYGNGFYFENSDKSILESCTSFEDYTEKTYEYVNNYDDAQTVIRSLNKIINLLRSSTSSNSYGTTTTSGNTSDLLRYINEQFSKYNAYNTVYSIDYANKKLIWKNDFGTNSVDFSQVEIRVDYENSWIGVYCLSGSKCIMQTTTSGSTAYYDKYTMSLIENGKMIGHIDEVVKKFAALKQTVVSGSRPTTSGGGASDRPDK